MVKNNNETYGLDENGKLPRKKFVALIILVCGSFVTFLNQTLVTPALPTITVELNTSTAIAQWLITGFTMVNAIMIPITAFLIDRFTTRKLFIIAMSVFLAGSLMCAWGPIFAILLIGRLLQAAGAGILMPMVMTELMVSFPPERRGGAMGMFGLVNAVAPTIGPTLAGIVIDNSNWHILFFIVSILSVVGIIAGGLVLNSDRTPARPDAKIDKPSLISSVVGLALLLFGFSTITQDGMLLSALVCLVIGAIILAYFVHLQLKLENPMLNVRVLKANRFLKATIICAIVQAAIMCAPILNPIYIQTIRGYSATISGLTLMPGAILMGVFNPIAGKLFDRHGVRKIAIAGLAVVVLATIGLCTLSLESSLLMITLYVSIRSVALAFVNMPITTWGMNQLENKYMNHGTSVNNTIRMSAGSLGTALMVSIYSVTASIAAGAGASTQSALLTGFSFGYVFSGVLCLIALIMTIFMVKDTARDKSFVKAHHEKASSLEAIMQRDVITISERESVAHAVEIFVNRGISGMPVVDASNKPVGFISDGDVLRALETRSKEYIDPIMLIMRSATDTTEFDEKIEKLLQQSVRVIAHAGVIQVQLHDSLDYVCRVLGENNLKKVPVVDDGKIVGVINRSDITKYALARYMESRID
jgi:MFS transporter, DHA2 family, multidrug resistance protein